MSREPLLIIPWKRPPKPPKGYRLSGLGEALMCPACKAIGTVLDYDSMGLGDILTPTREQAVAYDAMACLECGEIVVPVTVEPIGKPMPLFASLP